MNKHKGTSSLVVIALAVFLSGCMPTTYNVTSDPSGATVFVNGKPYGTTPMKIKIPVGQTYPVVLKKEGYTNASGALSDTPNMAEYAHFVLEEAAPKTFIQTTSPGWISVDIRAGVTPENAWNTVVDILVKKFDLAVLSQENGYVRTAWLYTWTGILTEDYRVRVTVKFAPNYSKVELKVEANYLAKSGHWVLGSDSALTTTLKTDIMGTLGRVTR